MAGKRPKSPLPAKRGPILAGARRSAANLPPGYGPFLEDLTARIQAARVKAALSVNRELVALYWHVGKSIVERQRAAGWGKAIVERLAADLQRAFPGMEGFSPRNIWRMRAFYQAWTEEVRKLPRPVAEADGQNLPQPVAEIPWGHNSAVDVQLRHSGDHPSIGIILCKTQKRLIVEYALRNTKTPIGVSEYKLTRIVPPELKSSLPSIRELEKELENVGEKEK